ncbi:hypothetical protein C7476_13517 [Phyllobacterium bourgognense]|uniref:Uncharacterized protein n=1 Tax=Phyllobacterium bourgognense TaxID=314236 RepID=A0A368YC75_9HYPH|nr:hypothetical protein C7476_13517 [Phyllobacterium bourgognense]
MGQIGFPVEGTRHSCSWVKPIEPEIGWTVAFIKLKHSRRIATRRQTRRLHSKLLTPRRSNDLGALNVERHGSR